MATPSVSIQSRVSPTPSRDRRSAYPWPLISTALGLCGILYLASEAIERWGGDNPTLANIGTALLDIKSHNIAECIAIGVSISLAFLWPRSLAAAIRSFDQAITRFAHNRRLAIVAAGALPLLLRLAVLPVLGVPQPFVADEFGYLLLADTFASGRIANPTHPFWKSLETVYVFHQPTYTSIYPIAPAIPMAIAKILGMHPWVGVWFMCGVMCALICWMLQAWMSPKWAFLGALLAVCRFTVFSPWMNSYWGGAVAAAAGALVLGSLPRLMKHHRLRDVLLFASGLVTLAQSRPLEGALFALPLIAMLGLWLLRDRHLSFGTKLSRIVLPVSIVLATLVAGTLWYNHRTTGSAFLPPYLWHQHLYGTPQPLMFQPAVLDAPGIHRYQDIAEVFQWQLHAHQDGFQWSHEGDRLQDFWLFYLQPLLSLPLLLSALALRKRNVLIAFLAGLTLLAGNAMYSFFFAHYAAPVCSLTILLIVLGLRHLRQFRFRGRPVGAAVFAGLVLCIFLTNVATLIGGMLQPIYITATHTPRGEVLKQLTEMGGKHLVLVHYNPGHRFDFGVVFNDADIDRSPVVWAHQSDKASDQALIKYYSDRAVWVFNPDESPVTLEPYTERPLIRSLVAGTGKRDDPHVGLAPGGIAVLLGANFAHDLNGTAGPGLLRGLPVRLLSVTPDFGHLFEPYDPPDPATKLPDLTVDFGGRRAPVLAVSNIEGQESVTVQVPFETPPGETSVTLRERGYPFTKKVTILPAAPGIFDIKSADGSVKAIILRQDGTMVDLEHPAHPGEILRMFATGLGPMQPQVRTGQVGTDDLAAPARQLIVGFHAQGIPLISARYAKGMVGVEEVTFQLPAAAAKGPDLPLSLAVLQDGQPVYSNTTRIPVN